MKVTFQIQGADPVQIECTAGENLLELARRANVAIDAPCSGNGACGKCRVRLVEGRLETLNSRHVSDEEYDAGWRLACHCRVTGDCTVLVPDIAAAYKGRMKIAALTDSEVGKAVSDILQNLGAIIPCDGFSVPELPCAAACAIDIGTTTVSAVLLDLKTGKILARGSVGNGQIRYGADVINRIIQQSKPGGRKKLQDAIIRETLIPLMTQLCTSSAISPDAVVRIAIGANTTMNHLLLGVDANPIRVEPYVPGFLTWEGLTAGDLGLPANPAAEIILAPNVGSWVGGDITAGTLASGIWDRDEMSLFIDLGTNGEIVFGNREFLITCACSAGPAFEGGDISCGMRSTDGAIESCTIDAATMEPTLKIIGSPDRKCVGICGSGIIDLVSELFRCGVINARGLFIREGPRILRDKHGMGRYVLAFAEESETGREVAINEVDIDNFIRAKGAIYSAIDTLLQSVDMTSDCIDHVYVAGGIGSGINMKNAVNIGMLPDMPLEKFRFIGNSSLTGACAMALSREAVRKCGEIAENMTYLELSTCPGYMDCFVAACFLPHTDKGRFPGSVQEVSHVS